jgi:hypothetical protein
LESGRACVGSAQCKSGRCQFPISSIDDGDGGTEEYYSRCGTCVTPLPEGSPCQGTTGSPVCAASMRCGDDVPSVCVRFRQSGETCQKPHDCASGNCVDGLCTDVGRLGASCSSPRGCGERLACVNSKCVQAVWGEPGASCDDDAQRCRHGACGEGGVCPALLRPGATCSPTDTTHTCPYYYSCSAGTCISDYAKCE